MSDKLARAIADLRADVARDKGGLVRVFGDQLTYVLDALEAEPEAFVKAKEKPKDPYASFKNEQGIWLPGLTVKVVKDIPAYSLIEVGDEGQIVGYNYNHSWGYIYRVQLYAYGSPISMSHDEIGL